MGLASSTTYYLYVYAINDGGTARLGVSAIQYDDTETKDITSEGGAGGADLNYPIYSGATTSAVPVRLIGRIKIATGASHSTGTTWANSPTVIAIGGRDDFKQRIHMQASLTSQTVANGASDTMLFSTKTVDTVNAMNTSTGIYTVAKDAIYEVCGVFSTQSVALTTATNRYVLARIAGSITKYFPLTPIWSSVTMYIAAGGCSIERYTRGQTIQIVISNQSGSSITTSTDANDNWFRVTEIGEYGP
jgi:hypothetical protein